MWWEQTELIRVDRTDNTEHISSPLLHHHHKVTELSILLTTSVRVVALDEGFYRFIRVDCPTGAATQLLLSWKYVIFGDIWVEKRRLWIWKFIKTHVIHVIVDKSQLGQSPDVMKVGLDSRSTWRATAHLLCSHLAPPSLRSCDIVCGAETIQVIMDTF